jgi:uncharacterized membrane protein SpoIIM required for sporulation
MLSNVWIDHRKNNWNRLDALLRQAESSGVRSLPAAELRELGLLYRQAAADLSAVRSEAATGPLEQYLNRLVSRAHNFVYSGTRISLGGIWRFFAHGYPRLLRRLSGYVALATGIFLAGALLSTVLMVLRPERAPMMLGPEMMDKINHHQMWTDSILSAEPQAYSKIATNNVAVCFYTFAGGILFGLGSLWFLFFNGLEIGLVATVCAQHGMSLSLWSFVAAHGALEIPSIMLAGAAGLRLGAGILFPGQLRRRESMAVGGQEAVQLLCGTVPLLLVAGVLEAFLDPSRAPLAVKFALCAVLFTGLCWWLGEGGRTTVSPTGK